MHRRILFFLYHYPPAMGTAAKRNHRIVDALLPYVERGDVFTASSVDTIEGENLHIHHVPAADYRQWMRGRTKDAAVPESVKQNVFSQWIVKLINTFPFSIIAGEGGLWYMFRLQSEAEALIKHQGVTHLYSSFRPFTDHYVAYRLKRKYPHLVWIADFRDLIIDPHYNHIFFPRRHQAFFKKVFRTANVLTTVSDGLALHLKAYHSNVITLRNGVPDDMPTPQPVPSECFTLVYTGSMFLDKRNADPIFKAIQELIQETEIEAQDIQIVYAGKDSGQWNKLAKQYRFEKLFVDLKIIPAEKAKVLQQKACINILLSIASDELHGVLTGKMVEYFEAGSPVLAIVMQQNDPELTAILHDIKIGDSFSDQEEDFPKIKAFILSEYKFWKSTGTNRKPVDLDILKEKYSMPSTIKPLLDML